MTTREVELVSYLPPFVAEYRQMKETLTAADPEFKLVWDAAARALRNEFIETADEYGIRRYEQMLKVYPSKEDTIESRRNRILARWMKTLPYTQKMLIEKLVSICGENDFSIIKGYDEYRIDIVVSAEAYGQVEELEDTIGTMVPANMILIIENKILCDIESSVTATGGVSFTETYFIASDEE